MLGELRIGGDRYRKEWDLDRAIQTSVAGFVDFAHTACA